MRRLAAVLIALALAPSALAQSLPTAAQFGSITFKGSSSGSTTVAAPASGSTITITLPGTAGTSGQVLTHGAGNTLAWASTAPALLLETGTTGAKISALSAFNLAAPPTGAEPLAVVQGGVTVQVTLAQLYTLFAGWLDFVAANPLDAPGGGGATGLELFFLAGNGDGVGGGGPLIIHAGDGGTNGAGGGAEIKAGNSGGGDNAGGSFTLNAGTGTGTSNGGALSLVGGGAAGSGAGGQLSLQAGQASGAGPGGLLQVVGGNSTAGVGGNLSLGGGTGGGGTGNVLMAGLPTVDPSVSNALWVDRGVLERSGGTPALAHTDVAQSFTKAQRGTPVTLSLSGATATPNYDNGQNFALTLVHASCPCTLANPSTTPVAGQAGQIVVTQSATGSDALAFGNKFKFAGGVAPTLSTGANAVDVLSYYVVSPTFIVVTALLNFQ